MKKTLLLLAVFGICAAAAQAQTIDRKKVLYRNNPVVTTADTLSSLSVGNGSFAATVDITGLQSFPEHYRNGVPLCTMSEWGWHSFPNTESYTRTETEKAFNLHGRESIYAVEYKQEGRNKGATEYFRVNPHRLNLATIGLEFDTPDGKAGITDITNARQTLSLWNGVIKSSYRVNKQPFSVITSALPDDDMLIAKVTSPMLKVGKARVKISFPLPTGKHSDDASAPSTADGGNLTLVETGNGFAIYKYTLDNQGYYITVKWEGEASLVAATDCVGLLLSTKSPTLAVGVGFSKDRPKGKIEAFAFSNALDRCKQGWHKYWAEGAFIDFGDCTDPRAKELERRVVLSQYLTKVNCAGSMPPQETGLTYNSWFGRPHLEMTWWHAMDFALWNRPEVVEQWLEWYNDTAAPEARKIAERQGFEGIRWMKMTDPEAGEAPSNTGSFLIWQQPHYIYLAEEMYRAKPTEETLKKYGDNVEATALFMADYAKACGKDADGIKLYGHTAMQESMSKDFSYHHPFEQAYWAYGLKTANEWRQRRGLPRHAEWDEIVKDMAPLHKQGDRYTSGAPLKPFAGKESADKPDGFDPYHTPELKGKSAIPEDEFLLKSRSDHPAVLGACGMLPATSLYDAETMRNTLHWVMDNWNWPTTWGWDYGMIAMAAARLGEPEIAVQALLTEKGKNTYLTSGHNFQEPKRLRLYLPGNGALLEAVAMMCAGWDNLPKGIVNPGFPADGGWNVRWEGLKPMQ